MSPELAFCKVKETPGYPEGKNPESRRFRENRGDKIKKKRIKFLISCFNNCEKINPDP